MESASCDFAPTSTAHSSTPRLTLFPTNGQRDEENSPPKSHLTIISRCFSIFRSKKPPPAAAFKHELFPAYSADLIESRVDRKPVQLPRIMSVMDARIDAVPYAWPHDGSLRPETTALVIIDMQRDFCSPEGYFHYQGYDISPVREIIPRLQNLLSVFRSKGFPIYHTREGHRPDLSTLSTREKYRSRNNPSSLGIGDRGPLGRLLIRGEPGHDIIPELYPIKGEQVIDKPGRSAFQHTEFKLMLNIKGVKNLVICGVTTDVCVASTMREANDNNFDCLLVEDATAASEAELHGGAVEMVKTEGGIFGAVSSSDKILEALEVAQEDRFRSNGGLDGVNGGKK